MADSRGRGRTADAPAVPDVSNVTGITIAVNRYGALLRNELGDGDSTHMATRVWDDMVGGPRVTIRNADSPASTSTVAPVSFVLGVIGQ